MLFPIRQEELKKCRFSSAFGERTHPITNKRTMHRGIDIAMPSGTPLQSLGNGVVLHSKVNGGGVNTGYGYYLVIKYDNGVTGLYAHLKALPSVKAGQRVSKGQIVANSGNTGTSTGSHLHFEIHEGNFLFLSQVKNKDSAVDPIKYYPQLENLLGKYLNSSLFDVKAIENKGVDDVKIVEFKEKWQETLFYDTIGKLNNKGKLHNAKEWLNKYKNKKLTVSELALLALVMAERD